MINFQNKYLFINIIKEVPINHPRRCPRPGCKNLRFVTADGNMFPFCGRQCALMHQQYNQ